MAKRRKRDLKLVQAPLALEVVSVEEGDKNARAENVYLSAFEIRFCKSRRMRRRSVRMASVVGTKAKIKPLRPGDRGELDLQHPHDIGDRDIGDLRPRRAGVEPRNVEQRADDLLDSFERDVDVVGEILVLLGVDPVALR